MTRQPTWTSQFRVLVRLGRGLHPVRTHARGRCLDDDRGSAPAETALAMALMMLLIAGVVQFALAEHAQHIAQAAAIQALTEAQAQDGTAGDGQAAGATALSQLAGDVLQDPHVTVTRTATQVTATVRGQVIGVFPGLHLPVAAHAAGPVERLTYPTSR